MKRATEATKAKRKTAGKPARKVAKKKTAAKTTGKSTRKRVTKSSGKSATRTNAEKTSANAPKKTSANAPLKASAKAPKKPAGEAEVKKAPPGPKGLKIGAGAKSARAIELRSILEAKRAEIMQEIRRARQDSVKNDRASYAEVGDLVSASVEKERAFEYGEIGVQALREIDTALEKLKEGTFGICEMCSKPIGIRRLKVMPSARLCIKCKSLEEASGPGARGRSLSEED